jgi:SAM-dependent methyltransferase
MAVPLTEYLMTGGTYDGFDIVAEGINWCRRRITRRYPAFHFQHADVFNQIYNPRSQFRASEFKFPYQDGTFDFVFATSVFTHMLPSDAEHYLSEIARVLRKNGRCLITFFLLNAESLQLTKSGAGTLNFEFARDGYRINTPECPEAAIAYAEERVRDLYHKNGLQITGPIHYGAWCGRPEFMSYQDVVVAIRKSGVDTEEQRPSM